MVDWQADQYSRGPAPATAQVSMLQAMQRGPDKFISGGQFRSGKKNEKVHDGLFALFAGFNELTAEACFPFIWQS